jgi:hypothetical protein
MVIRWNVGIDALTPDPDFHFILQRPGLPSIAAALP